MIQPEALANYCLLKPGAYLDYPFGPEPMVVKVRGRIFAEIYPRPEDYKITLKCDPDLADFYRRQFPGVVVRGYHCPPLQQPHRNTVFIAGMEEALLLRMIDHSYERVKKSLPRASREGLN